MKLKKSMISLLVLFFTHTAYTQTYKVIDTGQENYYNNIQEITAPSYGELFYGQDYDLWLRVIHKYDIANLDSILYCRRLHLDCISIEFGKIQYEFGKIIKKYYHQRVKNGFDDLDRGEKEEIENLLKHKDLVGNPLEYKKLVNTGHYYFSLGI